MPPIQGVADAVCGNIVLNTSLRHRFLCLASEVYRINGEGCPGSSVTNTCDCVRLFQNDNLGGVDADCCRRRVSSWGSLRLACVRRVVDPEEAKSVEVNGCPITYQETGSGDPLVLVHGFLNDYRIWYAQAPEFAKNYQVISVSYHHYYHEN